MTEQEIRIKALELAIQTIALLPTEARVKFLSADNNKVQQNVINTSRIFEEYIRGELNP
jgi:hypothetical protein